MQNMLNLITVLAFGAVFMGVWLLARLFTKRADPVAERLGKAHVVGAKHEAVFGGLTGGLASQLPSTASGRSNLERDLRRAGYLSPGAVQNFRAVRNALVIAIILLTAGLVAWIGPADMMSCVWVGSDGAIMALLAFAVPGFTVRTRGLRRLDRIEQGLPDALDIITMCLAGGLPLHAALEHVCREIQAPHPDLAQELDIVRQQAEMTNLTHAFRRFADRLDSTEIRMLSSLVFDAERLGADMQTATSEHADTIRRQTRQRADERANRTSVKMILPFVMFLVPSVMILLWGPAFLQLRDFVSKESLPGGALSQDIEASVRRLQRDRGLTGLTEDLPVQNNPNNNGQRGNR